MLTHVIVADQVAQRSQGHDQWCGAHEAQIQALAAGEAFLTTLTNIKIGLTGERELANILFSA